MKHLTHEIYAMYESETFNKIVESCGEHNDIESVLHKYQYYINIMNLFLENNTEFITTMNISGDIDNVKDRVSLLRREAETIKNMILDIIVKKDNTVNNDMLNRVYISFFDSICRVYDDNDNIVIPVITTNYDQTVERLTNNNRFHVIDGWQRDSYHNQFTWIGMNHINTVDESEINLVLYKLHGSIYWYKKIDSGEMLYGKDESLLRNDRIDKVAIPPAINATKGHEDIEIYSLMRRQSISIMHEAKIIIVVGYSFRDKYLNNRIFPAIVNGNSRIIIIDSNANGIKARMLTIFGDAIASRIYLINKPFDGEKKWLKQLNDNLNRIKEEMI